MREMFLKNTYWLVTVTQSRVLDTCPQFCFHVEFFLPFSFFLVTFSLPPGIHNLFTQKSRQAWQSTYWGWGEGNLG